MIFLFFSYLNHVILNLIILVEGSIKNSLNNKNLVLIIISAQSDPLSFIDYAFNSNNIVQITYSS